MRSHSQSSQAARSARSPLSGLPASAPLPPFQIYNGRNFLSALGQEQGGRQSGLAVRTLLDGDLIDCDPPDDWEGRPEKEGLAPTLEELQTWASHQPAVYGFVTTNTHADVAEGSPFLTLERGTRVQHCARAIDGCYLVTGIAKGGQLQERKIGWVAMNFVRPIQNPTLAGSASPARDHQPLEGERFFCGPTMEVCEACHLFQPCYGLDRNETVDTHDSGCTVGAGQLYMSPTTQGPTWKGSRV